MAILLDLEGGCLEIPDLGVTVRSLLAVANKGFVATKQRRWNIKYKRAYIGKVAVLKSDDHSGVIGNISVSDSYQKGSV